MHSLRAEPHTARLKHSLYGSRALRGRLANHKLEPIIADQRHVLWSALRHNVKPSVKEPSSMTSILQSSTRETIDGGSMVVMSSAT